MSYAVIKTGGKQYRVQQGDVLRVELLNAEEGANVNGSSRLLISLLYRSTEAVTRLLKKPRSAPILN